MSRKLQILSEIASRTTGQLTQNKASWRHFLDMAAKLYESSFTDAALIYAHNPNASTCRNAAGWAAQGRQINRGRKSHPPH